MKVLDFKKAKRQRPVVKVATKFMFLYRKLEQFVIDNDKVVGNLNTPQDIEDRIISVMDKKIKSIEDIDRLYYSALGITRKERSN